MRIIVAGGTGFIGEPLVRRLLDRGDDVAVLTRDLSKVKQGRALQWDGRTQGPWSAEVAAADAVINLAGEGIADARWTAERKRRLETSRLDSTGALVEAFRREPAHSRTLVNASAIGIYGDRGDQTLDESSERGAGFLADLVEKWEKAAQSAEPLARVAVLRFGVVLGAGGGALAKMLLPFKLGVGGPIASGRQWMSWVDRDDLLRAIVWAVDTPSARGVYNATAPEPVRSREFAQALGAVLHRPAVLPTPAFALKLAFGEMAEEALIAGQRVLPKRLLAEGFRFEHAELKQALARIVA